MKKRQILALGFFDGIHVGHAALLRRAVELAAAADAEPAVMTFDVHPDTLVTGAAVALINSPADRVEMIRRVSGIDTVFFLPFTRETMRMPWREFLDRLSAEHDAAGYVVGHDFRFGWRGEGDGEKLSAYCRERSLLCNVIPAVRLDGVLVSSTYIRSLLEHGNVREANRFLGHPHLLSGAAEAGFVPYESGVLALRDGVYTANILLPDGSRAVDHPVLAEARGVTLEGLGVGGAVRLEFLDRLAAGEEEP